MGFLWRNKQRYVRMFLAISSLQLVYRFRPTVLLNHMAVQMTVWNVAPMPQPYFPGLLFYLFLCCFPKIVVTLPHLDFYKDAYTNIFSLRLFFNKNSTAHFIDSSSFCNSEILLLAVAPFLCTDGFDVCISGIWSNAEKGSPG